MLRKGYDGTLEDALQFFEDKFKGTDEYAAFHNTSIYVKNHGLQHEVFVMAYNHCEDDATVEKCCQEINCAMMDWDI